MAKTHFPTPQGSGNEHAWMLAGYQFGWPLGNIFWVHSVTGTNGTGYGRSPASPLATIDYAVGLCTADNDDYIMVLPGHVETVIADGTLTVDVAGINIVGVGSQRQRPVINYTTAAAASVNITAARCRLENLAFTPIGVDAVTAAININKADVTIRNCEFELADATFQAALGILTAATAHRLLVEDCYFHGTVDAGTAAAIRHVAGNNCIIRNNVFHGAYTTTLGAIDNTAAVLNLQIHNNSINNLTASSAKCITCHASSTGQIRENTMQILTGTAPVAGAAMSWVGRNYYAATIVTAGTLI